LFDFKICVKEIMSKSPSRHLVRLQGKLKLTRKENNLRILKGLLFFNTRVCCSLGDISGLDSMKRKSRQTFDVVMPTKSVVFKNLALEGGGGAVVRRIPATPHPFPLGAPMHHCHCSCKQQELYHKPQPENEEYQHHPC
jgi:hypothetical protein